MPVDGVAGSLEVISKVAFFDPVDVGLKATLIVRFLPGFIVLLPLPLVILNIAASGPVSVEVIDKLALPVFLTTKEAVLLFFTFTVP